MLKPELRMLLGGRATEKEPLARHTTFRIGGPAELFVRADSREELIEIAKAAREAHTPVFILGNGSNILVADAGIRGLVIENHADQVSTEVLGGTIIVLAESGAPLPGLANRLARQGWSGLEWAIGVPSTVGAAVVGNAGAHEGSISDCLRRVEVLTPEGAVEWWPKSYLGYEYRSSRLKKRDLQEVVLRAEFELRGDEPAACIDRMNKYTDHRRRTQPTDPSVGSMFKNPPGEYAGRLIEDAGLKGTRVGSVEVSTVHGNFFVNHGGASARDVLDLVELVKRQVEAAFAVELELEIQLVGDWE